MNQHKHFFFFFFFINVRYIENVLYLVLRQDLWLYGYTI